MTTKKRNVLFLCTGNSARSILAEAILSRLGADRFAAFSAGSDPAGAVKPLALDLLKSHGYPVDLFRSKNWEEFTGPDAPELDFVVTLCDSAAGEACPAWPGQPLRTHWGLPDPAAVDGTPEEQRVAYADTYRKLTDRIRMLVTLPFESLDQPALQRQINAIGSKDATEPT